MANQEVKGIDRGNIAKKPAEKIFVLAGGGDAEAPWAKELYTAIAKLAGGSDANIGIITAASKFSKKRGDFYEQLFSEYGCKAEWLPIDTKNKKNNSNPNLVKRIKSMTGFFFGGGDQSRCVNCLRTKDGTDSPVLAAIRHVYDLGTVIAGTSAGTVVQSGSPMITGDTGFNAYGGFGFFPDVILDSHFQQRNREWRLIDLARKTNIQQAWGIDEDTIAVVRNANTPEVYYEVFGKHGVHMYKFSEKNVEVVHLKKGNVYCPSGALKELRD